MREYFKYTLIAFGIAIAAKLTIYYIDPLHMQSRVLYIMIAPLVTVLFLYPGMVATRNKEFDGYISGKLASAAGVRMAAISGVFNGVFDYLYYSLINKQVLAYHLAQNITIIKNSGNTPQMTESSIGGVTRFFTPFMQATFPMFITICAGFFFTVVFAYFIRRYRPGEKPSLQA